ncbi:hypothetical protein A1Q2_05855 [Trichosporon asahii var. asahii CBS 8904]|uniref:Fumarylacetoacetase-like C-terminal domain-containing protein n=1 Tax=Trichosporon asahii var. asahii (strain CBS 8904) TaxID=1220162 RepID=K1VGD5_TRIAC|nr:hypothetical protein A1Q2_05855 [Trichosporon asahii var. asahii CBS 8904]
MAPAPVRRGPAPQQKLPKQRYFKGKPGAEVRSDSDDDEEEDVILPTRSTAPKLDPNFVAGGAGKIMKMESSIKMDLSKAKIGDGGVKHDQAAQEAEEAAKRAEEEREQRKLDSKELAGETIKRELAEKEVSNDLIPDVDDTDGLDPEGEFDAWRARELKRLLRDKEKQAELDREREEIERRRAMPEDQRLAEDMAFAEETRAREKGEMGFLQKYYHKGAFHQDGDDELFNRDYTAATEKDVDMAALPKVLQVRDFGKASRTKYTHLTDQDTSQGGWGTAHQRFGLPSDYQQQQQGCWNCGGNHNRADCPMNSVEEGAPNLVAGFDMNQLDPKNRNKGKSFGRDRPGGSGSGRSFGTSANSSALGGSSRWGGGGDRDRERDRDDRGRGDRDRDDERRRRDDDYRRSSRYDDERESKRSRYDDRDRDRDSDRRRRHSRSPRGDRRDRDRDYDRDRRRDRSRSQHRFTMHDSSSTLSFGVSAVQFPSSRETSTLGTARRFAARSSGPMSPLAPRTSPPPRVLHITSFQSQHRQTPQPSNMSNFLRNGRKIVAIGRNYVDHAKELGNAVPKEPFFFLKPTSSYLSPGGNIEIPKGVVAHHEVELGVVIGKDGRDIPASKASEYIAGYTLAIDMTGRNMQDAAKKKGLPWAAAKGLDTFCPVGKFVPASAIPDNSNVGLQLTINGQVKQKGTTKDMIFDVSHLVEFVSGIMALQEGDVLLTGTPAGVGPVSAGDKVEVKMTYPGLDGKVLDEFSVGAVDRKGNYEFKAAL